MRFHHIVLMQVPGGTLGTWLLAATLAIVLIIAIGAVRRASHRKLAASAATTETWIDDALLAVVGATRMLLVITVVVAGCARLLELSPSISRMLTVATSGAITLQVGFWGAAAIRFWIQRTRSRGAADGSSIAMGLGAINFLAQVVLWSLLLLVALNNAGVDVTALIAGLGVGGIAIALAVQNILGDLFASLSIILDQPFMVGDFVIVDEYMGTIESVGLKTTRIRSLGGEQIVFSNSDLLKARLRNYKRMYERRVVFSFGVTYQATPDQLAAIPGIVREIIDAQPKVRFDRAHFAKFGDSSLDFEVVYWVLDADYGVYMDAQQTINLALLQRLAEHQVEFAYPTRTLHLATLPEAISGAGKPKGEARSAAPSRPRFTSQEVTS